MIKIKSIKILFILLITCTQFFSQIKIHKHLTIENGLVNNSVRRMIIDSRGYIWFATFGGLSRWDGNNFTNFTKYNGLNSAQVFDVEEGTDSTIYIANFLGRLQTYKNRKLSEFNKGETPGLKYVVNIYTAPDGLIYFLNGGTLQVIKNNIVKRIARKMGVPRVGYEDMLKKENGIIYLATWQGLYILENDTSFALTTRDGLNNNRVQTLCEDKNGVLYIGTLKGLNKYENGVVSKIMFNKKTITDNVFDILITESNTIYITTDNGVYIIDNETVKHLTENDGLSDNDILCVLEDKNGTIYFGTQDYGVDIYYPEKLESYKVTNKLFQQNILSIFIKENGEKYFGTENGLLVENNGNLQFYSFKKGILGGRVNTIYKNKKNILLFGCEYGLSVRNKKSFDKYSLNQKGKDLNQIYSIIEFTDNNYFAASESGLYKFNSNTIAKVNNKDRSLSFSLSSLIMLSDSTIVIGTHGFGVVFYKDNNIKKINTDNGLSNNIVNTLFLSSDSTLLVGTDQGGLNIINNYAVEDTININDGLTSNTIVDINTDETGQIYLSTPIGVNIITYRSGEYFVRTITKKDGLVSNKLNRNAAYKDQEGNIWFGTSEGISIYNPKADKPVTNPPKIYFAGLEVFNESYPIELLNSDNGLNYDQNYLKFIYTSINLSAPDKILYKYRLSAVDQNWVESKNNNVQYTSLDDGNYTFEVKARNEWGYWSDPISLSFVINPAWWETWWFRLAIISALGFMLWLAFQYRLNYLLKLERLRTKIASDLHDEVGSLLTQISVNADSLSYIKDEDKRKEKSGFIRAKSSEVINMMSDVIWSIDSRNDNLDSLVDRIHNFARNFLDQNNIRLNFSSNIKNIQNPLKIDFRQNVMLIAKEAINNAVKYSNCSQIDILINYNNEIFEITISDNGQGFDFENVKRGNGLKNMKMRAESIGTKIEFDNSNGFTINLNKTKL